MKDVRIMKEIIMEIYNNLQVLWNSKVKFVSMSWLLGWPLFGSNFGLFRALGFIVSPVGKREREGKRKKRREGGKQGIEKERKEGRRNKERSEARYGIFTKIKTKE